MSNEKQNLEKPTWMDLSCHLVRDQTDFLVKTFLIRSSALGERVLSIHPPEWTNGLNKAASEAIMRQESKINITTNFLDDFRVCP